MDLSKIKEVTCIGAGVIGSSWATNFLMKGLKVRLYDPLTEQLERARVQIGNNLEYLSSKNIFPVGFAGEAMNRVLFTSSMKEAVSGVFFIQESGPENYEIKQTILAEAESDAPTNAIFASSTSGLLISKISSKAKYPERCLGAHPYNPPHLIPLVELNKGEQTSEETVNTAVEFYRMLDKEPVVLQKEALGFIANRLALALYREAIDLVLRGVCTIEDVDKAICFGPGLRYAAIGPNLIYHLAGGPYGIKGALTHMGPSVELWWEDMATWNKLPGEWGELAEKGILSEIENRSPEHGRSVEGIERFRDDILLTLLKKHGKL